MEKFLGVLLLCVAAGAVEITLDGRTDVHTYDGHGALRWAVVKSNFVCSRDMKALALPRVC